MANKRSQLTNTEIGPQEYLSDEALLELVFAVQNGDEKAELSQKELNEHRGAQ